MEVQRNGGFGMRRVTDGFLLGCEFEGFGGGAVDVVPSVVGALISVVSLWLDMQRVMILTVAIAPSRFVIYRGHDCESSKYTEQFKSRYNCGSLSWCVAARLK